MVERQINQSRDEARRPGLETIRNRVDQFGVAEPTITRQGADQILIQLPGIQDPARAKALIGKTALLEFKMLDEQTSVEQALAGQLPETSELLYGREVDKQTKAERKVPYVVQKRTLLTGAELTRAEVQADPNSLGNWQVAIEFTAAGTRIFGELTEQNVGKRLAIVLDGNVYSAPRINERIPSGRAVITGHFTVDDARDLAIVPDDRRHALDGHGDRYHPAVLRHQLRQGLRRLAVHRTRREPLHRVLLHASALRPGVHGPAQARAGLDLIELFRNPNFDFIGKRKWAYIASIGFTLIALISLAAQSTKPIRSEEH